MQKRRILNVMGYLGRAVLWVLVLGGFIGGLSLLPLPLPVVADGWMLYSTAYALLRGIGIYDYEAQSALMHRVFGDLLQDVTQPYYVYPPWFVYSFFYLGFFSPDHAARLWFWTNLAMVGTAIYLFVGNRHVGSRVGALLMTLGWASLIGNLIVGQYVIPVLLGTVLIIIGVRRSHILMFALGMFLLTYKPHLGGGIFLFVIVWLLFQRRQWHYRAITATVLAHLGIGLIVFALTPSWLLDYLDALTKFRQQATFGICENCSSGATLLTALVLGRADTTTALYVGLGIACSGGLLWLVILQSKFHTSIEGTIYWSTLITLLSVPYMNNYDYAVLLPSFLWLVYTARLRVTKSFLAGAFCLPWLGVVFSNRSLFAALLASSALLMVLAILYEIYFAAKRSRVMNMEKLR